MCGGVNGVGRLLGSRPRPRFTGVTFFRGNQWSGNDGGVRSGGGAKQVWIRVYTGKSLGPAWQWWGLDCAALGRNFWGRTPFDNPFGKLSTKLRGASGHVREGTPVSWPRNPVCDSAGVCRSWGPQADHGSITSTPQPVKSSTFRVATEKPNECAVAAIWQSEWLMGSPEARRPAAIRA